MKIIAFVLHATMETSTTCNMSFNALICKKEQGDKILFNLFKIYIVLSIHSSACSSIDGNVNKLFLRKILASSMSAPTLIPERSLKPERRARKYHPMVCFLALE